MANHPNRSKKYPYAVMDGNEAPDQSRFPASCHMSVCAARRERDRLNRADPNYHYFVIAWNATRWALERPGPDQFAGAID